MKIKNMKKFDINLFAFILLVAGAAILWIFYNKDTPVFIALLAIVNLIFSRSKHEN